MAGGCLPAKGSGKDKSQMTCFQWRDKGVCAKHDAGTCPYAHPKALKGTGKPNDQGKGGGKKGKSRDSSSPGGRKGGKGSGDRSASPRKTVVSDRTKLCPHFLKGKCKKGENCPLHHNGICKFHTAGTCTKGDQCIFAHLDKGGSALALGSTAQSASDDGKSLTKKEQKAAAAKAKAAATNDG